MLVAKKGHDSFWQRHCFSVPALVKQPSSTAGAVGEASGGPKKAVGVNLTIEAMCIS